jgi:outer membrane protein assembly factor BamB
MLWKKGSYIALLAMVTGVADAQFAGPAPLAWRWQQSNAVAPTGAPLVDGNRLFYNAGTRMYAIDRETGNTLWKFPNIEPLSGFLKKSPVLINGVLVIATDDKKLYGVNPNSGELKWAVDVPGTVNSAPVGAGKNAAVSVEGGFIFAVNTETGMPLYDSAHLIPDGIAGPLNSNGTDSIYFFNGKSQLVSFQIASKQRNWTQTFGVRPPDGNLVATGGNLYLYTGTFLACLNGTTGNARWQQILPEPMMFTPELGSGTIACVSRDGKVYFYDETGRLRNRTPVATNSQPVTAPTFVGGKFVVATANGAITLVDPFALGIQWQYFIRPMNEAASRPSGGAGGGPTGGGGAFGAPGGAPGGGFGGGFGSPGGQGGPAAGGQTGGSTGPTTIVTLPAAAKGAIAGKTLLIPAADGSLLAFDEETGVDLTAPELRAVWPPQGELISGLNGQEFVFRIDDDASGVNSATIKFDIDGKAYNYDFGRDGFLVSRISVSQRNAPLANGRRTINISAKDWLGNEVKKSFSIRIDNSLAVVPRGQSKWSWCRRRRWIVE